MPLHHHPVLDKGQVRRQVPQLLTEMTGLPFKGRMAPKSRGDGGMDGIFESPDITMYAEYKSSGAAAPVALAIHRLKHLPAPFKPSSRRKTQTLSLLVVPFMGETGKRLCAEAGVSWLDLSGNARILAPGLRIHIEGQANRYRRPGRSTGVFTAKGARLARTLLLHGPRPWTQRELTQKSGLSEGFVSKLVKQMERDGLLGKTTAGTLCVPDPDLLLDSWLEAYDFSKHHVIRGHIAARSGDALLQRLAGLLSAQGVPYAATGLAAAWQQTHFAGFRLCTLYLKEIPDKLLDAAGFREDEQGANLWLVVPNDEGVFAEQRSWEGIMCVSPVQVFLDLKGHPERAQEAAAELRRTLLQWKEGPS